MVDVSLCHACHAKRTWMWDCATPATQSAAASRATKPDQARHPVPSVPRLPRLPRKTMVDVSLCHACHAKRTWMWDCATPATQSAAASRATKPDQAHHPVPSAPRLPRKTKVDVTVCHVDCMWECATVCVGVSEVSGVWVKLLYVRVCVCVCVKLWYVKFVCVWSYCMWEMVCDKVVCVWVCVKLLYVKFVCVKLLYVRDGMWQSCVCVWSYCMLSLCVCESIVC